jgi:hypothetical protein
MECINNFGGETSWKTATWKRQEVRDNINMDLTVTVCEDRSVWICVRIVPNDGFWY